MAEQKFPWQPTQAFECIVFDCDSTLTTIEGIDQLAIAADCYAAVAELTRAAMDQGAMDAGLFAQRLDLIKPNLKAITELGAIYCEHIVPNAKQVINFFQALGKHVYIVSAGLQLAVENLAKQFNVSSNNVFAVAVDFDAQGDYQGFAEQSPLVNIAGKAKILQDLQQKHGRLLFCGDGMNDIRASHAADRFIGFGGCAEREVVKSHCDLYILINDLAPVIPFALTQQETADLTAEQYPLYEAGLDAIKLHLVDIKGEEYAKTI